MARFLVVLVTEADSADEAIAEVCRGVGCDPELGGVAVVAEEDAFLLPDAAAAALAGPDATT